jgi:hypothetical protein
MYVIAFQVIRQLLFVRYLNMPKCQSSFACGRNCIFQTVKMKQKFRDDIWWWLFEWIEVSFLLFISFEIPVIYQFQLCFPLNSPDNIRIVNNKRSILPLLNMLLTFDFGHWWQHIRRNLIFCQTVPTLSKNLASMRSTFVFIKMQY